MPLQPVQSPEGLTQLHFPKAGIVMVNGFQKQGWQPQPANGQPDSVALLPAEFDGPPEKIAAYYKTTVQGINVRAYDTLQNRNRGGSRQGLSKYILQPVIAGWIVQCLNLIVGQASMNIPNGLWADDGATFLLADDNVTFLAQG